MIYQLHFLLGTLFLCYILCDRLYLRLFVKEKIREIIYKKIKWPMLILSLGLILTGLFMSIQMFEWIIVFKVILAFILLFSFFYCPLFMKECVVGYKRFMYRFFVLGLTVLVYILGVYI